MAVPVAIENVHYDPVSEVFRARVRIERFGLPYTYACEVDAPITSDFDALAPAFAAQAFDAHKNDKATLRSFLRNPDEAGLLAA